MLKLFSILISLLIIPNAFAITVQSKSVMVFKNEQIVIGKNPNKPLPLASITKLMTAIIVLDNNLDINESITITDDDVDHLKNTRSKLQVGATIPRFHLLYLALMSSDNMAAHALARTFPGGFHRFIALMNNQAELYHMKKTIFVDSSGLNPNNVSTAWDVSILAKKAREFEVIQTITSTPFSFFDVKTSNAFTQFHNTNKRVGRNANILLSKTGHINEVGFNITSIYSKDKDEYTIVILGAVSKKQRDKDLRTIEQKFKL